jgi:hypothetical protein
MRLRIRQWKLGPDPARVNLLPHSQDSGTRYGSNNVPYQSTDRRNERSSWICRLRCRVAAAAPPSACPVCRVQTAVSGFVELLTCGGARRRREIITQLTIGGMNGPLLGQRSARIGVSRFIRSIEPKILLVLFFHLDYKCDYPPILLIVIYCLSSPNK